MKVIVSAFPSKHDSRVMRFDLESDSEEHGFCETILVPYDMRNEEYLFDDLEFDSDSEGMKEWRLKEGQKSRERAIFFITNHKSEIVTEKEIDYEDKIVIVHEILKKHDAIASWRSDAIYFFVKDLIKGMVKTSDLGALAVKERLHGGTNSSMRELNNVTIDLLNDLNKITH